MLSLESFFGKDAAVLRDKNFQLLLLANILGPMGTGVVSPLLDTLTGQYDVSAADIGLMMAMFSAPAIVIIPLSGLLTDRYGRKPVLVTGLVLFGAAGTALAFTTDFRVVLLLRLLQGAGFAGIIPVIVTSIGDLYTGSTEASAQGIRFMGSGLSQFVFPFVAGTVVVLAWYYPFYLYAIALPIAAILVFRFDEPAEPTGSTGSRADVRSQLGSVLALIRHRYVLLIVIARGLPVVVWIGFLTYNSILVVQLLGGSPTQAGLLVGLGSLSYAVSASQTGRILGLFDTRVRPLVGAHLALGIGFAGVMSAPAIGIAYGSVVVTGVGFGFTLSVYRSMITGLADTSIRGSLVSLAEAFGRVTSTLTPIVMGASIAALTPLIGFAPAVRGTGLAVAVVGGLGGIICMAVVSISPLPAGIHTDPESVA